MEADLSNSDFEGVILSATDIKTSIHRGAGYLSQEPIPYFQPSDLTVKLFGKEYNNRHILSIQASGEDLVVEHIKFNNFQMAELQNANFKNAVLALAHLYSANLTNADLSGADLHYALLADADLSNANLQGANLEGARLDVANLQGAHLQDANLEGASLSGANLYGADLSGATYDKNTILDCVGHDICEANGI